MNLSGSSHSYYIQQRELGIPTEQIEKNISIMGMRARVKTLDILEDIKSYGIWKYEEIEGFDTAVPVVYKYPNGKFGDIDDFIASKVGKSKQISVLDYQVEIIPRDSYKELELLVGYYKQQFCSNKVKQYDENYNRVALDALISINRVWALIEQFYTWQWTIGKTDLYYDEIYDIIHNRYIYMKRARDEIYNKAIIKKKPSSKWTSEISAYTIVHSYYDDAIFQYQPEWLGKQSLDIYIPSKKVAIEYQGIQHFMEVPLFNGKEGLEQRKRRDKLKKELCQKNGIKLLEWMHDDPLTEDWFEAVFVKKIENNTND